MSQRELQRRAADASSEELAEILARDGCVVLKDFASEDQVASLMADLQPFVEATAHSFVRYVGESPITVVSKAASRSTGARAASSRRPGDASRAPARCCASALDW